MDFSSEEKRAAGEWDRLKAELKKHSAVWTDGNLKGSVCRNMVETALMGNGDMGVNSAGTACEKSYLISKQEFWDYPGTNRLSVGGVTIREPLVEFTTGLSARGDAEAAGYPLRVVFEDGMAEAGGVPAPASGTSDPHGRCFVVDLGSVRSLKRYELYHHFVYGMVPGNTVSFTVEVSADGAAYETVQTVTDNIAAVTAYSFDSARSVRFVRVNITSPVCKPTDSPLRTVQMRFYGPAGSEGSCAGAFPFKETLSMTDGTLCTEMTVGRSPLRILSRVSATENVLITEISNTGSAPAQLECNLFVCGDNKNCPLSAGVNADGSIWAAKESDGSKQGKDERSWVSKVVLSSRLLGADGTASSVSMQDAQILFELQPGKTAYLITAAAGGGRTWDSRGMLLREEPSCEAARVLAKFGSFADLDALAEADGEWWKTYWLKSYIDVGDDQLHRYYYGSLYYMACTARAHMLPSGLYGIWATTDSSYWHADYHLNYNMIAPFYGMYSANRPEFARSLKDPLLQYMEEGRRRAKTDLALEKGYRQMVAAYIHGGEYAAEQQISGFVYEWNSGKSPVFPGREDLKDGIDDAVMYPVGIGPWGSTPGDAYLEQPHNAAFTGMAVTAYYSYTKDARYFEEVYPFLLANANFFEKWCEKEVFADGSYRYNIWGGSHEGTFDLNAGAAVGTVRNLLKCLIDAQADGVLRIGTGKGCCVSREKFNVWLDMYEHFAEMPVGDGYHGQGIDYDKPVVLLTEDGVKLTKSTNTTLEAVVPGYLIGFDSDPALREAARNCLELKEIIKPDYWDIINETPKAFPISVRCGVDPEYVIGKFRETLKKRMCENYIIQDNYHGIEKAGAVEFINGMLLGSDQGIVKVFPNWTGKDASFTRLREQGAFVISSGMKNGRVTGIEVTGEAGGTAVFVNPWSDISVMDSDGKPVAFAKGKTRNTGEETVSFRTEAGATYVLLEKTTGDI